MSTLRSDMDQNSIVWWPAPIQDRLPHEYLQAHGFDNRKIMTEEDNDLCVTRGEHQFSTGPKSKYGK